MQSIDRISIISQNERNTVSLVCLSNSDTLAILKERQGASFSVLQKIAELKSPYFPAVYEIEQNSNSVSILEEQICGKPLRELLDFGTSFSENEFIAIVESVAKALITLHSATPPIILRDLKPENIMITDNKRIMIVDLDAAREYDSQTSDKSQDTVLLGTRSYAAPEQYGFTQTDVRSDIYSFGIVIQELLGNSHCNDAFVKKAQKILRRATMFAPEDRYQDMRQMFSDIRHLRRALPEKILRIVFSASCALVVGIISVVAAIAKQDSRTSAVLPADETTIETTGAQETDSEIADSESDIFSVWVPGESSTQETPGGDLFYYNNAIIHRDESGAYCFWGFPDEYQPTKVTVPSTVYSVRITILDKYALAGRDTLTEVILTDGITAIRDGACQGCYNLKKITIPDSVTEFGDNIFERCTQVTIYCHKGSAAEKYAMANSIVYKIIE